MRWFCVLVRCLQTLQLRKAIAREVESTLVGYTKSRDPVVAYLYATDPKRAKMFVRARTGADDFNFGYWSECSGPDASQALVDMARGDALDFAVKTHIKSHGGMSKAALLAPFVAKHMGVEWMDLDSAIAANKKSFDSTVGKAKTRLDDLKESWKKRKLGKGADGDVKDATKRKT